MNQTINCVLCNKDFEREVTVRATAGAYCDECAVSVHRMMGVKQ